jgi:hypothetical protein
VSRHMGLFAAGRLAERHGVRIRLRARSPYGLTAMIWLPESITERQARPDGWRAAGQPGPRVAAFARSGSADGGTIVRSAAVPSPRDAVVPAYSAVATSEIRPAAASATSDWFHRAPAAAHGGSSLPTAAASQDGSGWQSERDATWADSKHAAQIIADPVRGDNTYAGLPRRVPLANLLPGSAGGRHAAGRATNRVADVPDAQATAAPRPRRSPEMARKRLSGFQSGPRRANSQVPGEQGGSGR